MKKITLTDFLILLLAYICIVSFPINYITKDDLITNLISIGLRILYIIFAFTFIKKNKYQIKQKSVKKEIGFFLPFFIVCFSNCFIGLLEKQLVWEVNIGLLLSSFIVSFLTATCEEIVFRFASFSLLKEKAKLERILLSAAIFGAIHFINFFSSFNPGVFVQIIYSFGIGILLGFIYEFTHSLNFCILLHFFFNSLNSDLFKAIYRGSAGTFYYILNVVVGIVVGIYCLILYLLRYRTKNK